MKLSEAILLGSIGSEQGTGSLVRDRKACAIGAALIAEGIVTVESNTDYTGVILEALRLWPVLKQNLQCPACGDRSTGHWIIGAHLNDRHNWTRPQIAAWIATVEPQEVSTPTTQEPALVEATR